MSVAFDKIARHQTVYTKPANTSATTVYTASNMTATFEAISISCHTAGSASVTINDGSTDFVVLDTYAMDANTSELFTFGNPILLDGYTIKVTSSTANYFTFATTIAEQFRAQQ